MPGHGLSADGWAMVVRVIRGIRGSFLSCVVASRAVASHFMTPSAVQRLTSSGLILSGCAANSRLAMCAAMGEGGCVSLLPMRLIPLHRLFFAAWLGLLAISACAAEAAPEARSTISVVTLNLYHDRADWPKRRVQIAETLRALRPDVVLLQEVLQHEKLPNQAEWLAGEIGCAAYFVSVDPADRVHRYGNALLTPHPILQRDQVSLEPRSDSRTAGMLRLDVRGAVINVYVTHLHHTGEGVALRERQVVDLAAFIRRTGGNVPSLVGGDFNTVADAPELAALTARYADSFGTLHPDAGPETTTLNRAWFAAPRRIDHIFFERDRFKPVHSEILFTTPDAEGTWASDHHGLLSRFAVGAKRSEASPSNEPKN